MTAREAPAPTTVAFRLNGEPVEVAGAGGRRLLDVLRQDFGLTGAKEGCSEGECGACSVLVDGDVVVSCLVPVAQIADRSVVTVEGLGLGESVRGGHDEADDLDPLQRAFHETDAVQCGMCTPGMLLAARAYLDRGGGPDEAGIREAIAGNLCRCTGYVKVVEAIAKAALSPSAGLVVDDPKGRGAGPTGRPGVRRVTGKGGGGSLLRPKTLDEAVALLAAGGRRAIAGGTDVMVELASEGLREAVPLVDLSGLEELRGIDIADGELVVGAATTYSELRRSQLVCDVLPILAEVAGQVGATQIQNRGTVGGNIATASPAGDLPPLLLAAEASIETLGTDGGRTIPASAFWTGYRQTALAPGEVVTRLRFPLIPGRELRYRKVGARRAQAIAKVSLAIGWRSDGVAWRNVRIGLGSVAERPVRGLNAEAALEGRTPGSLVADHAAWAIERDARPIDDIRSTAAYRRTVTGRILRRIVLDASSDG